MIGSIRRDSLDHVIILGKWHLRAILKSYLDYYHSSRTHLALSKDTPASRAVQPPELGAIVELPQVGGPIIDTSGELHSCFILPARAAHR